MAEKRLALILEARDKASKVISNVVGGVRGLGKEVAKMGAIASGAAAAGLAVLVQQQIEAVSTTQRVAERIGETTEALSRLEYAGQKTGTSIDRVQEGLSEMVQRLGEARTGTGSAADGLKAIGLDVEKLVRMKPAEAFAEIADAINKLPNQADRNFQIDEIFGGDGRELINLISQGSAGMARLGDEADRLGYTLNNIEGRKVLEASEAMHQIKAAAMGAARQIAVALAPSIQQVAAAVTQLPIREIGQAAARAIRMGLEGIQAIMRLLPGVGDSMAELTFAVTHFQEIANVAFQKVMVKAGEFGDTVRAVGAFIGSNVTAHVRNVITIWKTNLQNALQIASNFANNIGPVMGNVAEIIARVTKGIPDLFAAAWMDVQTVQASAIRAMSEVIKTIPDYYRAAFNDVLTIASAAWEALKTQSLKPFENLGEKLKLDDVAADLGKRLQDATKDLRLDNSAVAKEAAQLASRLQEPFANLKADLLKDTKAINWGEMLANYTGFDIVASEFTKGAKASLELAQASLKTDRERFFAARKQAADEDRRSAAGGAGSPGDGDGKGKGAAHGAAGAGGRAGFQGEQLGERFEGLLEQFKMGREVVRRTAEQVPQADPQRADRGGNAFSMPAAMVQTLIAPQVIERTKEVFDRTREVFRSAMQHLQERTTVTAPQVVEQIRETVTVHGGSERPAVGPSPQMQTLARETQAGLVPLQETASNTRAMLAELRQLRTKLETLATKQAAGSAGIQGANLYPL